MIRERVETLLGSLDLDDAGLANAAIALTLAAKLDEARESSHGAAAIATPALSKELRAVIQEILDSTSDRNEFVTDLFS